MKHLLTNEKVVFWGLLALVCAVVWYAPLHYGFVYPSGGDDTANNIRDLIGLAANSNYDTVSVYRGFAFLIPFVKLGLDPITVFSVFVYLVIPLVFITMWLLVRRFYGFQAAVLSFIIAVFVVPGTWYYFESGTVFNIFNLLVVGLPAIYGLMRWLETSRYRWLALSGAFFIAASVVHTTTYMYMVAAISLFTAGYALRAHLKRRPEQLKAIVQFAGVFAVSMLTAWFTWASEEVPRLVGLAAGTVSTGEPLTEGYAPRELIPWVGHYLNIAAVILAGIAVLLFMAIHKTGTAEDKEAIKHRLNQPLSYLLLSFILVFAVGAFSLLGVNSERFGRDLATFLGLSTAIGLGVALAYYRLASRRLVIIAVTALILANCLPVWGWLGNYTALKAVDRQVISYLESLEHPQMQVQVSATMAPWILSLYADEGISFERVYDTSEVSEADYFIYRNSHMTYGTEHRGLTLQQPLNLGILAAHPELELLKIFTGEDTLVMAVYQVKNDN